MVWRRVEEEEDRGGRKKRFERESVSLKWDVPLEKNCCFKFGQPCPYKRNALRDLALPLIELALLI